MVEDLKITIEDGKVIASTLEYDGSRTVWAYSDETETRLHLTGHAMTELHDCAEQLLEVAGEHDLLLTADPLRWQAEKEALRQEISVLEEQWRRDDRERAHLRRWSESLKRENSALKTRIADLEALLGKQQHAAPTRPRPLRRPR